MKTKFLYKLLESHVLTEGRKEDVMAKYPDVPVNIIEAFIEGETLEPQFKSVWKSKDNKYLEWMVGEYTKGSNTVSRIIDLIKNFYEKESVMTKGNIEKIIETRGDDLGDEGLNLKAFQTNPKEIKVYPNYDTLKIFIDALNEIKSEGQKLKQTKAEGKKIADGEYEGKKFRVISPTTYAASCHYGRFSQWCVATANTGHYYNYTKKGTLYFFLQEEKEGSTPIKPEWGDQTRTQGTGVQPFKTALLIEDDGEKSWWTKSDIRYDGWVGDRGFEWFTQDIADKVMAYNKKAIETRKQREIEIIVKSEGFYRKSGGDNNLKETFRGLISNDVFTKEQLEKIIRNNNWLLLFSTAEESEKTRKILGKQKVFELTRQMIQSASVSGELNDLLRDIDSQKFLSSYVDKNYGKEECKGIAELIIKRLGKKPSGSDFGSDVKLFVDKWTMSPEEMEKYLTTSNYFFVGVMENVEYGDTFRKKLVVSDLTKVDRFNPNTHDALTIMMYAVTKRASSNTSVGLYAIVTEKDALDPYIGVESEEIPDSVIDLMMEKSKNIFSKK
jgi:hypothetical protein